MFPFFAYNTTPFLKPFYKIDVEFDLKEEVIIKLKLTTYKYNYDRYLDDLLKFRPKSISQVKDEIGIEIKNSEAIN